MGGGVPTAGFVYKLVAAAARAGPDALQHPVAKRSPGKATLGGRKWAWRLLDGSGQAVGEEVATDPRPPKRPDQSARPLQVHVIAHGEVVHRPTSAEIRAHHELARAELTPGGHLTLHHRGDES
jgi:nicotinate phosphoribosyltransferase